MSNKTKTQENYLDRVPVIKEGIEWLADENGIVTINIINKGFFNRLAQLLFRKPKVSHIHLEENGSFVWQTIDGKMNIAEIGILVKERFGEKAEPLYERLAKYFQMLDNCGFITWCK